MEKFEDLQGHIDFSSSGIFQAPFGPVWEIPSYPIISAYNAHYDNEPALRLQAMLREWTGYEASALFTTGSEATEAFWRLMRVYTGKPGIWGGLINPDEAGKDHPDPPYDSMHGMTLGALIMAGKMSFPGPGCFNWIGYEFFGRPQDQTGCAIFEPYHAPSAQFHKEIPTMERIRSNIKHFPDIHFCCDEIQGGLGRTGKLFAHQWYLDLKPEFVTIGKMLGGGLPVSALLGPKAILEDPLTLEHSHMHSTHSGNPFLCNIACAAVERIQKENLIQRSLELGHVLHTALEKLPVRVHSGRGLLAGLEMDGPLQASKVVLKCREKGLLVVDTGRKWVKIGPALTITEEEIVNGCKILAEAIEEVKDADTKTLRDSSEGSGDSGAELHQAGAEAVGDNEDVPGAEDGGQQG